MTLLTVDIAFDWDSNAKAGYDGFCLCGASGFDMGLAGSKVPSGVRGIGKQDQLQFQIYDISDGATGEKSIDQLEIAFQSAHAANTSSYPFESDRVGKASHGWYPLGDLSLSGPAAGGNSAVYGGPYWTWQVLPRPLTMANAGWYFFRVSFRVAYDGGRKTFGNDPEMIVRPSG